VALPNTLQFGRVTFWGGVLGANFTGDDNPDDRPWQGTIVFSPSVPVAYVTASPRSRTLFIESATFGVDGDGIMRDGQGNDGVKLMSPESTGLLQRSWTWIATFFPSNGSPQFPTVPFHLPSGGTVDLTTVATGVAETGSSGAVVTRGLSAYEVAVANGFVGTEVEWLDSLHYSGAGGVATVPNATATVTGGVRLTGDFGGTATAPTVPGLTSRVTTTTYTAGIAGAKDRANHTGVQAISTVTGLQVALDAKAGLAQGFTRVTTTAGAYPATRPAGVGAVWFDDPAVTPPAWAALRDRWGSV
jgi:hypothetical protein